MGDLRTDQTRLDELKAFILLREGNMPYFYNDNMGLVTVGIGTLVRTIDDARRIAADSNVQFVFANNSHKLATPAEVVEDWERVHASPNVHEKASARIAQLRLRSTSVSYLMIEEIKKHADRMYQLHPFLTAFDSRIAMALVDTRYNPAGINPFRGARVARLWAALNPMKETYDLYTAFDLFKKTWASRGGKNAKRYATRHAQRVLWFGGGVEAMPIKTLAEAEDANAKALRPMFRQNELKKPWEI